MKVYLVKLSAVVAVVVALYCVLYQYLPIKNLLWMTFISLPIYFGSGAKIEEFGHYFFSMITGIIWGVIYLKGIGYLSGAGVNLAITLFLVVGVVTFILCTLHLAVIGSTWLSKVPMMFGAVAAVFSQNGQNLGSIFVTLTAGLILAVIFGPLTNLFHRNKTESATS